MRSGFLEIYDLFPGSWGSNCYILISDGHAAVVDPSASAQRIIDFVKSKDATLDYIILTHGHFDHIMALDTLRDTTSIPAYVHKDDAEMLTDGKKNAYYFFFGQDKKYRPAEKVLCHGDKLTLGADTLEIISTPGHSKGSICILCRKDKIMLTGDTIFAESYGRYDLYGGDRTTLMNSLSSFHQYDRDITIYPGHGESAKLSYALDNLYFV